MENTHFCDSTGLHNPDHYSTVKDIAVLMKYCIKNDTFREIVETSRHSTGVTNIHPDGITYYSTMFKNLSIRSLISLFFFHPVAFSTNSRFLETERSVNN